MPKAGAHYRKRLDLSDRQREVLRLIARGRTNFEIARALGITLDGAKYHVSEILAKLDVPTREEAVVVWREYNRPGARAGRLAGTIASGFAALPAGVKLSGAVAVVVVAVVGGVALWPQEATEGAQAAPETPEKLLETMADVLGEDGQVLELEAALVVEEAGGEPQDYGTIRAWFAFEDERARIEYEKGPDNTTDTSEALTVWIDGEDYYIQSPDDDAPRKTIMEEQWRGCLQMEPLFAEMIACGITDWVGDQRTSSVALVSDGDWEGRAAIGLAFEQVQQINSGPPTGTPPTPTPGAGTPTVPAIPESYTWRAAYEFLVDGTSYLPLGVRMTMEADGVPFGAWETRYDARLRGAGQVDESMFDPRASGFRTPSEEEMDLLDDPHGGGPVYWLGREFGAGPEIGTLRLSRVDQRYHPERPTLITLYYEGDFGADSSVIEVWEEEGWRNFFAHLQDVDNNSGRFPFGEACTEVEEFEVNGFLGRVIAGYNYERREPAGVIVSTPGVAPPTPTPFPPEPCPERPHDEFMVEVYIDGYVVTLNAPIGIFELGEGYEAYDAPERLKEIASGLRERHDGE